MVSGEDREAKAAQWLQRFPLKLILRRSMQIRPLMVEVLDEVIELRLLLEEVLRQWLGSFLLRGSDASVRGGRSAAGCRA